MLMTVGDIMQKDLTLSFLNGFGFECDYRERGELLTYDSPLLGLHFIRDDSPLRDLCGFSYHDISAQTESTQVIRDTFFKSGPVGIQIDSYDVPWNKWYKKRHNLHYFIVRDIKKDIFVCRDYYLLDEDIEVSEHSLKKTLLVFAFKLQDLLAPKDEEGATNYLKSILPGQELRRSHLSHFFSLLRKTEAVTKNEDIESSNLLFGISNIVWDRYNFAKALHMIGKLSEASVPMDLVKKDWAVLKQMLIKNYLLVKMGYRPLDLEDCFSAISKSELACLNMLWKLV